MKHRVLFTAMVTLGLGSAACSDDTTVGDSVDSSSETTGDGDGDSAGDGDGDSDSAGDGDGDGDTAGDGDGDPGDGDGDSGDGDGDPAGDGDGDTAGDGDGDTAGDGDGDQSFCGDGVVDMGEECDLGDLNADNAECTASCTVATCGDGLVYEGFEECDDANEDNSDACVEGCVAATCEDGFLFVGSETDLDCGGETCMPCEVGQACLVGGDCVSDFCDEQNLCALDILSAAITVTNEGDVELTDWQVPVDLTDLNFPYADALPDGADIRFSSDNINPDLPYWIENWTANGDSRVWVKVPAIPANGSVDIYLIYGDDMLMDASDGDATFEFFDDHEDGDYMDKWSNNGAQALVEQDGALTLTGASNWAYAASMTTFDYEIEIHTDLFAGGQSSGLVIADDDSNLRYTFRQTGNNTGVTWDPDVSGSNSWENSNYPGVPFTQGQVRRVTCATRLAGNQVEIIDYCDSNNCSVAGATLTRTPFAAVRVGISNYSLASGPVASELMFVTKHTEANVFAVVN